MSEENLLINDDNDEIINNNIPISTLDKFIEVELNLPNHESELDNAEGNINSLKKSIDLHIKHKSINDKNHTSLYDKVSEILFYVGGLSKSRFLVQDELEQIYFSKYIHSPELAKTLYYQHYENIHHRYTIVKQRCYRLLDDLDESYFKLNKKTPPNWKYSNWND